MRRFSKDPWLAAKKDMVPHQSMASALSLLYTLALGGNGRLQRNHQGH